MLCYEVLLVANTWIQKGAFETAVESMYKTIGLILILNYWLLQNADDVIKVLMIVFEMLIYTNSVLMLLFPQGLYNQSAGQTKFYWLFGHQNQTILYVLCAILVAVLYHYCIYSGRLFCVRSLLLILAGIWMIVYAWSATAMMGIAIVFGMMFLYKIKIHLGVTTGIAFSFLIFLGIIIFRQQSFFSWLITNVLHRSMTFSGRTGIWDKALDCIKGAVIWGYGYENWRMAKSRFGFNTPHNRYLYILYQGGIVLFIVFLLMLFLVAKEIKDAENTLLKSVAVGCICALLVQMQFESYTNILFYVPFILAVNINAFKPSAKGRVMYYKQIFSKE